MECSSVELSSLLRTKRESEMVLAPVRGAERSFIKANCSLLMSKENQKTTSDFDALEPRKRGCTLNVQPLNKPILFSSGLKFFYVCLYLRLGKRIYK